ncbi:hypothetical protein F7725_012871 [Dissostichus mawsoni]|uniref:Uncharacterized protein n=1 Tax=Dissostichus mawsoni TaxID=36200 RepID=A0A7J5YQT6_DISMA|nr:hypothetical protein F7725_012871 [Dissostichus mawsoni]
MQASRTLLSKQTLAVVARQPACFVHHGDHGNWGNTNIAVDVAGGMGLMSMREYSKYYFRIIA